MEPLDWLVLAGFMATVFVLGLYFSRRSSKDTGEFFISGRNLPWWLAGTSMIATNFNADSALHQSRKVRTTGLAGCWFYWSQIIGMIASAIILSKFWRRAKIVTAVEFYDIRYYGRPATAGRVLSVIIQGFILGLFGISFGLLAVIKISNVMFDLPPTVHILGVFPAVPTNLLIVLGAVAIAMVYSAAAGLWGVVATDLVEFVVAMVCSYILLFIVYREVGWASGLKEQLATLATSAPEMAANTGVNNVKSYVSLAPTLGFTFLVWFLVQPLVFVTEGGPVAQRYMACKNEREATLSGIWRVMNHFALRSWPWYVCGLASWIVLRGNAEVIADAELTFPVLIREFLPTGILGLMMAGFVGAFMSTIDTSIHSFGSIFVNDLYRPFIRKEASERHYIWISRIAIIFYTITACAIALSSESILGLLFLFYKVSIGASLVLLLRWFWWRVNIWADISAQISAVVIAFILEFDDTIFGQGAGPTAWLMAQFGFTGSDPRYSMQLLITLAVSTIIWLTVMWLTKPEP